MTVTVELSESEVEAVVTESHENDALEGRQPMLLGSNWGALATTVAVELSENAKVEVATKERSENDALEGRQPVILAWEDHCCDSGCTWIRKGRRPEGRTSSARAAQLVRVWVWVWGCRCFCL